jgi:hypothetical protein
VLSKWTALWQFWHSKSLIFISCIREHDAADTVTPAPNAASPGLFRENRSTEDLSRHAGERGSKGPIAASSGNAGA